MAGVLESQTNTCCCKACWKGTETDSSLASWDRSGRNMLHKYANNMHLYVKKMKKIGEIQTAFSALVKQSKDMHEMCQQYA